MNKSVIKILEALSKAVDVDLEFTDENPETEDNFDGVKEKGKQDMPKEKFDKAGGTGTPKKMDTDPKMDKPSDKGIQGGAKQKDSKTLKKEAFLIQKVEQLTGKKVVLKEYYDEPEEIQTEPAVNTQSKNNLVTKEELQRRKNLSINWTKQSIKAMYEIIEKSKAEIAAGKTPSNSIGYAENTIANWKKKIAEEEKQPLENYLLVGEELQEDNLDEASRAERILKGKGTGNLKA